MSEPRTAYTVTAPSTIPRDLFNFWRRVLKLQRGRVYNLLLEIPERQDDAITWTFLGDGKRENEG